MADIWYCPNDKCPHYVLTEERCMAEFEGNCAICGERFIEDTGNEPVVYTEGENIMTISRGEEEIHIILSGMNDKELVDLINAFNGICSRVIQELSKRR